MHRTTGPLFLLPLALALLPAEARSQTAGETRSEWFERSFGREHLPRFQLGRDLGASEAFAPYAVDLPDTGGDSPTSGIIASPPEYGPTDGVLFRYGAGWNSVVTDCVVGLTADPTKDEIAYVVVTSTSQRSSAQTAFANAGADLSKVQFIIEPSNSIWLRDYGPHFIWQGGATAIADSHYYPSRPSDNYIPTKLAEGAFQIPAYPMGLYYSGGNFQPGPNRSGYITSLIFQDNPGFSTAYVGELYQKYQGIDTLHVFPRLPSSVDGTGHIDMWMYLIDEDDVIISEFVPGSNATAIQITDDAAEYMEGLGFTVWRTPAWNVGFTHYTYTNAFRVNDRIFSIKYRDGNASYADEDAAALATFQAAAGPGVEIIPIDCYSIIPASGAIHCIVMQVPRYTDPAPSAHVCSPDGGEHLVAGNTERIQWTASDDEAVTSVDLYYSTDGGLTFPYLIASGLADDSVHDWTVPNTPSTRARLKVVATDALASTAEAVSERSFSISRYPQTVYDFSTGTGVDRWAWGSSTTSWSGAVAQNRYPVTTELSLGAYERLWTSNATGGDSDPGRYIAPTPSGGRETTHVFEFQLAEPRREMVDVAIAWEGYGDACLQMELYVWDHVEQDWGDGLGGVGENSYMDIFAGNADATLTGHIRADFRRYVDNTGRITFLLYGERSNQESFHDTVSVTVTHRDGPRHQSTPRLGSPPRD